MFSNYQFSFPVWGCDQGSQCCHGQRSSQSSCIFQAVRNITWLFKLDLQRCTLWLAKLVDWLKIVCMFKRRVNRQYDCGREKIFGSYFVWGWGRDPVGLADWSQHPLKYWHQPHELNQWFPQTQVYQVISCPYRQCQRWGFKRLKLKIKSNLKI